MTPMKKDSSLNTKRVFVKGTVQPDFFTFRFFINRSPPGPLTNGSQNFQLLVENIRQVI